MGHTDIELGIVGYQDSIVTGKHYYQLLVYVTTLEQPSNNVKILF